MKSRLYDKGRSANWERMHLLVEEGRRDEGNQRNVEETNATRAPNDTNSSLAKCGISGSQLEVVTTHDSVTSHETPVRINQ